LQDSNGVSRVDDSVFEQFHPHDGRGDFCAHCRLLLRKDGAERGGLRCDRLILSFCNLNADDNGFILLFGSFLWPEPVNDSRDQQKRDEDDQRTTPSAPPPPSFKASLVAPGWLVSRGRARLCIVVLLNHCPVACLRRVSAT